MNTQIQGKTETGTHRDRVTTRQGHTEGHTKTMIHKDRVT
jgi:hypothetical protein